MHLARVVLWTISATSDNPGTDHLTTEGCLLTQQPSAPSRAHRRCRERSEADGRLRVCALGAGAMQSIISQGVNDLRQATFLAPPLGATQPARRVDHPRETPSVLRWSGISFVRVGEHRRK